MLARPRLGCLLALQIVLLSSFPQKGKSDAEFLAKFSAMREQMGVGQFRAAATSCAELIDRYPCFLPLYETYAEICQYEGSLSEALRFFESHFDGSPKTAYCYYGLGCAYIRLGDFVSAHEAFQRALLFGVIDARITRKIAYAYERAYGNHNAIVHFRVLCQRHPNRGDYWYSLSLPLWGGGDYSNAIAAAKKAVALNPEEVQYRIAVAALACVSGHDQTNQNSVLDLIRLAREMCDHESIGLLKSIRVRKLIAEERLEEARSETAELLSEMSRIGNLRWSGWSFLRLSDIDIHAADCVSSLENARRAASIAERSHESELKFEATTRQFDCFMDLGMIREAIQNAQERLRHPADGFLASHANVLADLARVFLEMGEYEIALEYGIRSTLSIERSIVEPEVAARVHSILGQIYLGLGEVKEAKDQFSLERGILRALPYSVRSFATLEGNMGNCLISEGRWKNAKVSFERQLRLAVAGGDSRERAYALSNLGTYYTRIGNYGAARRSYFKALKIAQRLSLHRVLVESSHGLSIVAECTGSSDETIQWLDRTLAERRKSDWLARTGVLATRGSGIFGDDFERLISLLFHSKKKTDAFYACETHNAGEAMLHLQSSGAVRVHQRSVDDTRPRTAGSVPNHKGTSDTDPQIGGQRDLEGSQEIDDFAEILGGGNDSLTMPEMFLQAERSVIGNSLRTVAQAQREDLSDGRTTILEYFIGETHSFLFVVSRDTFEVFQLDATRNVLRSLVGQLGSFLDASPCKSAVAVGRSYFNKRVADSLSKVLLMPARELIQRSSRLLIIRGGDLESLPFEALPLLESPAPSNQDCHRRFLVEHFEIAYRYSLLWPCKHSSTSRDGAPFLLAVGSPNETHAREAGGARDSYLLHSHTRQALRRAGRIEAELRWLEKGFGAWMDVVSEGSLAKEDLLRAFEKCSIAHIATHQDINDSARGCEVVLSTGSGLEGTEIPITMSDVLKLRMVAKLVILSSCRTARPQVRFSRLDFAKCFLLAGAESAIGSLWEADDESTEKLMKAFYTWLRAGATKGKALQEAKKELIRSGKDDPYYWASFILVGNDEAVDFPKDTTVWLVGYPGLVVMSGVLGWVALVVYRRRTTLVRKQLA
jgi:CHAT domain-containing protein/tetratricopeptide (TPR) repeat protein